MDISHYVNYGYQVFRNVLPLPLLEEVRKILECDVNQSLDKAMSDIGEIRDKEIIDVIDRFATGCHPREMYISNETRMTLSGHISLQTRLSADLRKIPTHPNITSIVRNLLRSESICMHMPPTARFVLPGNRHAGVPPHQDILYNRHMSEFVVMWVPLVDITDDMGGVVVFENTGNLEEQSIGIATTKFWKGGVDVEGYSPVHCTMKRGDVLALNKHVVHASMPNKGPGIRYSVDHRFFSKDIGSEKHYLDLQTGIIAEPGVVNENI